MKTHGVKKHYVYGVCIKKTPFTKRDKKHTHNNRFFIREKQPFRHRETHKTKKIILITPDNHGTLYRRPRLGIKSFRTYLIIKNNYCSALKKKEKKKKPIYAIKIYLNEKKYKNVDVKSGRSQCVLNDFFFIPLLV